MRIDESPGTEHRLMGLMRDAATLAEASGRDDLHARIDSSIDRLADPTTRLVVVGQFKQGKSALVNALVDAPVCPVDDVIGTSIPTILSYGEKLSAALHTESGGELRSMPIDIRTLRDHVTEIAAKGGGLRAISAEVTLPSKMLADGLVFVDTPGVGGTTAAHSASTLTMLPMADAVLMVSDASQEYTEPELAFLKQAQVLCPTVTCVLSKTDLHRHWRDIAETDREHLLDAGLDFAVVPVSASSHLIAVSSGDSDLDVESGIPELARRIRTDLVEQLTAAKYRSETGELRSVTEHLALALQSELETLRDPKGGPRLVQTLEEAQAAAAALSKRSARWQQTLNDGIADLESDIDYDLRDRLRRTSKEAERLLEECDPGEVWDDFGRWLADAVAQAVADNFVWAHQRSEHLAATVAEHFNAEGDVDLPKFQISNTDGVLNPITGLDLVRSGHIRFAQKIIIGMRGSYGGVLMFGLLTGLAGLALVNPISVAAGVVIGTYSYRQDSAQRLERRRKEGKVAVRRLIDEAIFQVGKESRDRLRQAKRIQRDHFTRVAEDVKRSLQDSIESAKNGVKTRSADRDDRIGQLVERLTSLQNMVAEAEAVTSSDAAYAPVGAGTPE
ncbi:MAG: dynamin family protein [Aeromicrobium sp.]